MGDNLYLVIKSLHIISFICWMCGIFYLPRLFVYHSKVNPKSESDKIFKIMEKKLLKIIMNPAMIATFIFGFWLIFMIGFQKWLHLKILLVLILAGFHGFLAKCRKDFEKSQNKHSEKFYRIINEIPTLLMVAIVFLAVLKPL
jgi:putative membrane protein